MKKAPLLFLYLILSLSIFADNADIKDSANVRIDSLENLLYNSLSLNLSTSDKISICNQLSELYDEKSWEKQIEYSSRSLVLAEETNDTKQIIISLTLLSNAYRKLDNYEKGIEYATRLYSIQNANKNEIEAAKALSEIGSCYYDWSK